jgi:hypothetical protein
VCYGRGMDIAKVKEAAEREHVRSGDPRTPAYDMRGAEDRALLLNAVPDMLAEIDRLKALASEGWALARDLAESEGDLQIEARAVEALKEIEAES